ncbi:hypothetical protein M9Y10_043877 [Tritrichomonas musculus]|uniref:mitogen-activated protein kinase kinase n=1 Tax=Tritrichomonas musculus TaxID=1915356 RepID=A0ABR2K1D3_9EUKA
MTYSCRAFNANFPNRYINLGFKKGLDIFSLKKQIIKRSLIASSQKFVTDVMFLKNIDGAPEKTHKKFNTDIFIKEDFKYKTHDEDLFNSVYEKEDAYEIFTKHNVKDFYFLSLFLELEITIKGTNQDHIYKIPLSFDNNVYDDLVTSICSKYNYSRDQIHIFQNNNALDEIDTNVDLKKYQKTGLIIFAFPIQVMFTYIQSRKKPILKYNEPLRFYENQIQNSLNLKSSKLEFSIKGEIIPNHIPIHQILKKYTEDQIIIDIKDVSPKRENTNETQIQAQDQSKIKDLIAYFSSKEVTNLKEANYIIGEDIEEHHKVLERIGEGATSVAYKIIDEETQKVMCKKILKITKTTTYKDLINGVKEFEVLYSINHPCICQAFGYNPTEPVQDSTEENMTTIAIFLEYLEYSLKECLEKKILNDTFKAKIVVEVAHGMNYIHKLKMIHRDLKIENIMLNPVYEAKIIDFGLARVEEISQDSLTKGVGTFHYMSPEMANQEDYDIKTDVYSFGICIYYIFTGKLPDQSLRDKLNGKPIPLPKSSTTISPFCIELISKCTSPRPDDRPAFIDIIEDMKRHSFMLSSNVDSEIVSHRNLELEIINHINEK